MGELEDLTSAEFHDLYDNAPIPEDHKKYAISTANNLANELQRKSRADEDYQERFKEFEDWYKICKRFGLNIHERVEGIYDRFKDRE